MKLYYTSQMFIITIITISCQIIIIFSRLPGCLMYFHRVAQNG